MSVERKIRQAIDELLNNAYLDWTQYNGYGGWVIKRGVFEKIIEKLKEIVKCQPDK